jgi:hypothetical protein
MNEVAIRKITLSQDRREKRDWETKEEMGG